MKEEREIALTKALGVLFMMFTVCAIVADIIGWTLRETEVVFFAASCLFYLWAYLEERGNKNER
jgi:uncharacterized membrane protein YjjP (DUF1212 family)